MITYGDIHDLMWQAALARHQLEHAEDWAACAVACDNGHELAAKMLTSGTPLSPEETTWLTSIHSHFIAARGVAWNRGDIGDLRDHISQAGNDALRLYESLWQAGEVRTWPER